MKKFIIALFLISSTVLAGGINVTSRPPVAAATSHQWVNSILASGATTTTQPAFSDISGTLGSVATSVTSNSSSTFHIDTLRAACTGAGCTIFAQTGSWISSIGRTSAGLYTVVITAGEFSSAPACLVGTAQNGGTNNIYACGQGTPVTATSLPVACGVASVANQEQDFNVLCFAPH